MPSGSSYIPVQKSAYPVLLALFTTIFILSNIVSTKGVQVGPLVTDGAFFLFPAAYVIGDVISECYGFRAARRAVWTGFLAMIIAVSTFYVAILLPAASFYEGQAAFAATLGLVPRIVVASLSGYAAGQLLNAWLLTLMKDRLGERGLCGRHWLRWRSCRSHTWLFAASRLTNDSTCLRIRVCSLRSIRR